MNAQEAVKSLEEYVNFSLTVLAESSTNPRKTFDEEKLEKLAESIRGKGALSPRGRSTGISKSCRSAALSRRTGLPEMPDRVVDLTDEEALETQIVESIQRTDVHPFEEARGFHALLERDGTGTRLRG
jgi:ParB family chromosome partitioning protein